MEETKKSRILIYFCPTLSCESGMSVSTSKRARVQAELAAAEPEAKAASAVTLTCPFTVLSSDVGRCFGQWLSCHEVACWIQTCKLARAQFAGIYKWRLRELVVRVRKWRKNRHAVEFLASHPDYKPSAFYSPTGADTCDICQSFVSMRRGVWTWITTTYNWVRGREYDRVKELICIGCLKRLRKLNLENGNQDPNSLAPYDGMKSSTHSQSNIANHRYIGCSQAHAAAVHVRSNRLTDVIAWLRCQSCQNTNAKRENHVSIWCANCAGCDCLSDFDWMLS